MENGRYIPSKEQSSSREKKPDLGFGRAAAETARRVTLAAGLFLGGVGEMQDASPVHAESRVKDIDAETADRKKEIVALGTVWLKNHAMGGMSVEAEEGRDMKEALSLFVMVGTEKRMLGTIRGTKDKFKFSADTFETSLENLFWNNHNLFFQSNAEARRVISKQGLSLDIEGRTLQLSAKGFENKVLEFQAVPDENYLVVFSAEGDTLVIKAYDRKKGVKVIRVKDGKPV